MPRYSAVAPTFNPIDYKTRIQPLEQYKEEYDKRLDALDEQGVLADAIGGLIDEQQDPELARIYKDYSNKMNTVASDLLRTGDLRSSRQSLRELRSDYANKLVPIQQAFNSRAEAGKAFRNAKMKDPSLRGNDPLSYSLLDYMGGKNPDVFTVSGDRIYAEGLADAKAQVSRVENVMKDWGLDPKLGSQYFSRLVANGYSADQVSAALAQMAGKDITDPSSLKAIQGVNEVYDYISGALNRLYSSSGVNNLENSADQREIMGRALNGILAGISYDETADYKGYNPSLWTDAEIKRRQLRGTDNNPQREGALSYKDSPVVKVGNDVKTLGEVTELLSNLKRGKVHINDEAGKMISGVSPLPYGSPTIGNPNYIRTSKKETYGDVLWNFAKNFGEVPDGMTKEKFLDSISNVTDEAYDDTINRMQEKIMNNSMLYSEAYSNLTDLKYWVQTVNNANATHYDDKGKNKSGTSLIHDSRGENVESIPEGGSYRLPVKGEDRKGIRYDAGTGKDKRVYYISPSAFHNSVVTIYSSDANGNVSIYAQHTIPEALNIYYRALDSNNGGMASIYKKSIMDSLASNGIDVVPIQSGTSSEITPKFK